MYLDYLINKKKAPKWACKTAKVYNAMLNLSNREEIKYTLHSVNDAKLPFTTEKIQEKLKTNKQGIDS